MSTQLSSRTWPIRSVQVQLSSVAHPKSEPPLRAASGSQEDPEHRRANQNPPRTTPLTMETLGAMKAKGQARLEPPRKSWLCIYGLLHAGSGLHGVRGGGRLHGGGNTRTTKGPLLLRRMRAALCLGRCVAPVGDVLAFCLLLCCCVAVPCPFTPGEQTGQHPSSLLMLKLCSCHCPQSLVGRYPRSSGSSVILWATLGSPGTHGIEQGRNNLSVRDAR